MTTINKSFKVLTDAEGAYRMTQIFNPPGFWDYNIKVGAKLLAPPETTITGRLEITAADDSTANSPQNFTMTTGKTIDLGEWKLDGGDNSIKVSGQTAPVRTFASLEIELTAEV